MVKDGKHLLELVIAPIMSLNMLREELLNTYVGEIQLKEDETIAPGEEKDATVVFLNFAEIEKYLKVGRKWWIHEGPVKVGEAVILEFINHD